MKLWRVVLLLVLTLVLPVRGALAVSMGMAVEAPIGMAHSAAPANADVPCPHHAQPTDHTLAADHNDDHHSAHTHLLCDVCNVLALNVPIPVAKRADTRPTHAAQGNERFSSVVPPIGHKPPIPV
jgi:hypothetical protein